MPDEYKQHEKSQPTDEERRKAAAKASAHDPTGGRRAQVHVSTPEPAAKPKAGPGGVEPKESFGHAGRAVRAPPPANQESADPHLAGTNDEGLLPGDERNESESDEEADASDTAFPIDERIERRMRTRRGTDEEEY